MSVTALDVVIITVIPCELQAVRGALGLRDRDRVQDEVGTVYFRGSVRSALSGRSLEVAVTCIGTAGNSVATAATRDAITRWRPRAVLLVGIAAGVRDRLALGNVVLSERVVAYEHAAVVEEVDGSKDKPRPEGTRLSHAMAQQLVSYEPNAVRLAERVGRAGGRFPGKHFDVRDKIATEIAVIRTTIASGDKLLRDARKQQEIRELHGKIEAFDMESAGFVEACQRDHIPWLVIRGISDFGDARKDDSSQDFAARAAAAVLSDFLTHGLDLPPAQSLSNNTWRPSIGMLVPRYVDERVRALGEQLLDALRRREALAHEGFGRASVDEEILELKRKLREGGRLRAGDVLGSRYLLAEMIGRGGFATVWKAFDQTSRTTVAVKVLHSEIAGDVIRRDRFFRGARIMATIADPAIVRVLDVPGEDGGFCYFVMEYLPCGDLRRAILEHRLDRMQSLDAVVRIGEALANAHARGVIHRDVKPANILLDANNHAKLTDFDLVAVSDTTGGTRTGALGTFVYAAPECLDQPQDADERADVYGLGMTLLFCIHGAELPMELLQGRDAFIDELRCSESLRTAIKVATNWHRERRPKLIRDYCTVLRAAISSGVSHGVDEPTEGSDILYWFSDGSAHATVWLSGAQGGIRIMGFAPGLILAAGDRVWTATKQRRMIDTFTPEALGIYWQRVEGQDDNPFDLPTEKKEVHDTALIEQTAGELLLLGGEAFDGLAFERDTSLAILGSVGTYLFISTGVYAYSGGAHGYYSVTFRVIDLRSGLTIEIMSPHERSYIAAELEQRAVTALKKVEVDDNEFWSDSSPELTMFTFSYGGPNGTTLEAQYQFTVQTYYPASDNNWNSYTRSQSIESDMLPSALEAYRDAPDLLKRYWAVAPKVGTRSGWTAVSRSRETRAILRRVFEKGSGE